MRIHFGVAHGSVGERAHLLGPLTIKRVHCVPGNCSVISLADDLTSKELCKLPEKRKDTPR